MAIVRRAPIGLVKEISTRRAAHGADKAAAAAFSGVAVTLPTSGIIGWLAGGARQPLGPAADPGTFPVGILGIVERLRG